MSANIIRSSTILKKSTILHTATFPKKQITVHDYTLLLTFSITQLTECTIFINYSARKVIHL